MAVSGHGGLVELMIFLMVSACRTLFTNKQTPFNMSPYDSDDSTLVDNRSRRPRRQRRYRSPSEDSYSTSSPPRQSHADEEPRRPRGRRSRSTYADEPKREDKSRSETINKASIAVGLFSAVVALMQLWTMKKSAEREKEAKRRKQREFQRAKQARRREESRWERQRQWDDEERSPVAESRRIGYAPAQERSRLRAPRKIEAPPPPLPESGRTSRRSSVGEIGYESDRRSRRGE